MPLKYSTPAIMLGFLLPLIATAKSAGEPDPLFRSHDILDVRIIAPFHTIMRKRASGNEFDGKLQYTTEVGESVEVDVGIRTRGRYRMQKRVCGFAPLRLNFRKSQTRHSLFHKQDKVKLVTHCKNDSRRYEQSLIREYFAYRVLNELTDISFRVRLLRVTYVDTDGRNPDRSTYGIIIEHKDRLARRLGVEAMDIAATRPSRLEPAYTNLISMFHYLISNTDFSPVKGAKEVCCHNHVLIGEEGDLLYSVPYDFDMSGLVNAPHAAPNPRFRLPDVRRRLYRGRCANNGYLDATIAHYQEKRPAIFAMADRLSALEESERKRMTEFISAFYDTIASPEKVESRLVKKCI